MERLMKWYLAREDEFLYLRLTERLIDLDFHDFLRLIKQHVQMNDMLSAGFCFLHYRRNDAKIEC
ncbi:hypothetical protein IW16_19910 [Chryseobacterium vrystaatense]|uniref:Uncharacterized protein n=2 Tax=Chryseobacterium vrystaatense TaxID=307480 RepID=A0ABR4UIR6_9FLAO|nr:hypothetical protein IW16_19910 [Chryseobacterium vrystaatense]